MFRHYLQLTKPGIIFGNLITLIGGFLLASKGNFDPVLFLATAVSVSLIVASGCVFNNYIDRDIDVKMERTKNRALVTGLISPHHALIFASVLGLLGITLLYTMTNLLATLLVVLGFVVYVGFYSLYLKRHSVYGTLVGSISGAMPPVIGYCAVSNQFDLGALILLVIFSIWQMPHSFAIAIYRFQDYAAASIPVLPVKEGILTAKKHIVGWIIAYTLATLSLTIAGYTGYVYFVAAAIMGLYWLYLAIKGFSVSDDQVWAKKLFLVSVIIITILSVLMAVDYQR
ncbi:heme o synthase [Aquirhabdus parva]|uniref:Protoheme IX farnesyltransferase n=1 Tax=Aquirhabdus parva TaxID=2283318 RepID=A0A345P4Y8_9GAMM|nr:heme o synthase [Aquirhabdus parva]AXI02347.1 protoheme IX farnesyltransferase [Aquirhabdus parva]